MTRPEARLRLKGLRILRIPARHLYGDIEPAVLMILGHCRPPILPEREAHGED